ncbi:MAG TPA: diguanylate cyclase [Gemmatimonadaceae bacterium]
MSTSTSAAFLTADGKALPSAVAAWMAERGLQCVVCTDADSLMRISLRGRPRIAVVDGRTDVALAEQACSRLKADSYTGVIPTVALTSSMGADMERCFAAGADEVISDATALGELTSRLNASLARSDRDVHVHPSTRLPGTDAIENAIASRMAAGHIFAVCYADLDHFKEYNDRYSYYEGDRVIRVLARILHDVVKGVCGEEGFVGHIGGDDFIFIIPAEAVQDVCTEVVTVFDLLVPVQYSESDRRAGYFFGKDRRGQLHRVPLMTVSIGVVTNERRHFTTASHVSELATEMKGYAKTLPGSVFAVDRRHQDTPTGLGAVPGLSTSTPRNR